MESTTELTGLKDTLSTSLMYEEPLESPEVHALIDGDIFCYAFGSAKTETGDPVPWAFVISRMDAQLSNILTTVGATSFQIYLTGSGNFRERLAVIKPYKGTRPTSKPYWYASVKSFLLSHRNAYLCEGYEADDALAIEQRKALKAGKKTVICSLDKDLRQVPGWHYSWGKDEKPWWQTEFNGLKSLYKQMLTGDTVDNIPGLLGVGKSSVLLKRIDEAETLGEIEKLVAEEYKRRFGSFASYFMHENWLLLKMLEKDEEIDEHLNKSIAHLLPQTLKDQLLEQHTTTGDEFYV